MDDSGQPSESASNAGEYVVVARRYRPQTFGDLVGQEQVSQSLSKAIESHRVGHAYLFTGARGVGKTSTARILAKALNCVHGPTPTPCNECDICRGVTAGEDVDVLEIDGASARGIDEIRQLRSNVNVRPSRARFKVYIIDEVHMFTREAFNALLKTLEEPPEHVKFIFCTTDPEKIPITVLSRCQRFDFPPVQTASIAERLRTICVAEKVEAEPEALQLLARRAAGSMRDSQSLLEQLLSFCEGRITAADVHKMLGTARGGSLTLLAVELAERRPDGALRALETAIRDGVDVGQLAEQLLAYFRDVLAATVGCSPDLLLQAIPDDHPQLAQMGQRLGLETLLAIIQVLDQAIVRMRQSPHVRTLLEVALVRITRLENLDEISRWVGLIQSGATPGTVGAEKKTAERTELGRLPPAPSVSTAPSAAEATTANSTTSVVPAPAAANSTGRESSSPASRASAASTAGEVTSSAAPPGGASPNAATTSVASSPAAAVSRPTPSAAANPATRGAPARPQDPNAALDEAAYGETAYGDASYGDAAYGQETYARPNVAPATQPSTTRNAPATALAADGGRADASDSEAAVQVGVTLTAANAEAIWRKGLDRLAADADITADFASKYVAVRAAGPSRLVVEFESEYNKTYCERPERFQRLVHMVAAELGRSVQLDFVVSSRAAAPTAPPKPTAVMRRQLLRDVENHPLVIQAKQLFDAEVIRVDEPRRTE